MAGYIILTDLPTYKVEIDSVTIEAQGGFRGFHSVPEGTHRLGVEDYSEEMIYIDAIVTDGDAVHISYDDGALVEVDPNEPNKYKLLAIRGAMGTALWPYPPDITNIEDSETIQAIFAEANRLKFLLIDKYEIDLNEVISIGVGKDIVGIRMSDKTYFFQMGEAEEVLMPPIYGVSPVTAEYDPWLWQNLLEIIVDCG